VKRISLNSKDQKIWFVSDLHLGHNKPFILGPRNYSSINEAIDHQWQMMNEHIVQALYDDCRKQLDLLEDDIEIYPLNYPSSPFVFLGHYAEVWIDDVMCVLTHYPIASWNRIGKGAYNIHGHCHRNLKEDLSIKRLDVGWEWKRRPVEWNEIVRELSPRKGFAPDHRRESE